MSERDTEESALEAMAAALTPLSEAADAVEAWLGEGASEVLLTRALRRRFAEVLEAHLSHGDPRMAVVAEALDEEPAGV